MAGRHGATVYFFLIFGAIFFLGPVLGVIFSGIGSAIGIFNQRGKNQAEVSGVQRLNERFLLYNDSEGLLVKMDGGVFPDKTVLGPDIDSLGWNNKGVIAYSNARWYVLPVKGSVVGYESYDEYRTATAVEGLHTIRMQRP